MRVIVLLVELLRGAGKAGSPKDVVQLSTAAFSLNELPLAGEALACGDGARLLNALAG